MNEIVQVPERGQREVPEARVMDVGFIGLGRMGAGMAANLLKAGHRVTVYNRTPAKAEALIAQGAKRAAGIADACRGEAVITRRGIEGGAIYALSADLREAIAKAGEAELLVVLRPDIGAADLVKRLSAPRGKIFARDEELLSLLARR